MATLIWSERAFARSAGAFLRVAAGVALALCVVPAVAKEGDTFRPFASYTRYYDSNLFRLAESEYGAVPQRSDQYNVLSAGVNVDWQPGRQRIVASAAKNLVRFSRYDYLDYDGSDYQLRWNWRLGNHWTGHLGGNETLTQSSFSDLVGTQINNEVKRKNRFANAEWQFHPRWSVGAGVATADSTNSTLQQSPLDYEDDSVSATLGYTTPKGSKVRTELRRIDGKYPNRSGLYVDREYTQTELNVLSDWTVSGKLTARGRVGYVQRENSTLSQRDFSGVAGRVSADYSPTPKTAVSLAVYREVANSDDLNASYQVNTGTSLGGAWRATSKISLRASAAFENRSFEGNTGLGGTQRDEDTLSGSLSMSYKPIQAVSIDLGVQAGRRESNIPVNDYKFHSVFVSVRADF